MPQANRQAMTTPAETRKAKALILLLHVAGKFVRNADAISGRRIARH